MKRVLSLVLALVLVLGMIPTFAADMTGAEHLKEHAFISGDENGDLMVDNMLTRQQLAAIIAELNGVKEEASEFALPPAYADVAKIGGWAKPFVAYAQVNEWMTGKPGNMFDPLNGVPAQQLAAVILNVLGYEFTWDTALTVAEDLGIMIDANGVLTRGEAFEALWVAVSEVPMNTEAGLTLGVHLGKLDAPVVAPTALAVASITAVNNKQVEIKFNKAVDSTTALDEANYVIKDKGTTTIALDTASASLSEDKMTVTITLDKVITDKLTNSTNASVTVKKAIKDAEGVALAADFTKTDVVVYDGVAPEALSVIATGLKTLEVTFSEPIYDGTDAVFTSGNFEIKSGAYTYFVNSAVALDNVLTLGVGTNLQDGPITVTFNKLAEIQDYAGIKAFQGTVNLTFVKDTTAPVATVKEASQTSVTIAFNKPVNATGLKLYHSVSGVANYGDTQNVVAAKEVTFTFPVNKLPQGNVNLYLVNSATAGQEVTDLFGNKMADTNLTTVITIDTTAPTVSETKLNTNASFDITFSEKIDVAQAKVANFTVKKASDATAVSFVVTNDGAKKVTLTFNSALTDNTDYEIVVLAMKDAAGNAMASTASYVVNPGDNTHPTVSSSYIADTDTAYIVFSEDMNQTDMLNKAMYIVDGVALDSNDTLTAVSAKKVKITFYDDNMVGGTTDIVLGALKDLAGKTLVNATTFSTTLTNVAADTLELSSAKLIAKNKIKLTFTKELANFDNLEFAIRQTDDGVISTGAITIASVESMTVNSTGKTEVVVVLDGNIQTDAKDVTEAIEVWTVNTPVNTKSVEGTVLSADDAKDEVTLADTLGGAIKVVSDKKVINTVDTDANSKIDRIVVQYDEAVKPATLSLLTYTVEDYTITAVAADDDGVGAPTGAGAFVVITVTEQDDADPAATPAVTQALAIQDVAGNTIAATSALASQDKVVPAAVATIVGDADNAVEAGEKLVLTFNEATDKPVLTIANFTVENAHIFGADATYVWDAAGKVLTITFAAGVTLVDGDDIAFAAVDTVEDAAGNDFGTAVVYTVVAAAAAGF